jgi:ketosteroid isomerase-like protein
MANYGRSPRIAMALLFFTLVFSPWADAGGGDDETAKATRQTLDEGIAAFNREDLDTTLKALHSNSPNYQVSKERISRIFHDHDVAMELVDFDFVGETGPYAIARVKVKSAKKSGTKFKNNTTESLYIFQKQGNEWKLWGEYELQTVFDDKQ